MAKKQAMWKTKGMNRDLSVSAFNPEFSFENRNLRLSTNDGNTLLSWVNERGTKEVEVTFNYAGTGSSTIEGYPIGTAVLNDKLVLFTTKYTGKTDSWSGDNDYIYVLEYSEKAVLGMSGKRLYRGNLNFSTQNPIETQVSYESDKIQKVYWTDGRNTLRVINIASSNTAKWNGSSTCFDSIPTLQLKETITVSRLLDSSGDFAPGVIQYSFTYYNKYGQESNIFYTSPLRFVAHTDRGGAPDERINTAFKIEITNVDTNFDFLRIYSIQRTSLNGTPICKRVADIEISILNGTSVSYIDTGVNGDTVDPTELLYKGGEEIVVKALGQKDNTLFLGNLTIKRPSLVAGLESEGYYDPVKHKISGVSVIVDDTKNSISDASGSYHAGNVYNYFNQLSGKNSSGEVGVPCAGFKNGDTYRLGVQFQYKTGAWSNPLFIEDKTLGDAENVYNPDIQTNTLDNYRFEGSLSAELTQYLKEKGYVKARAVIVYPDIQDRRTLCQGVVCPTLYTNRHRAENKNLLAQSSWFFRPIKGTSEAYTNNNGTASPWSHTSTIPYTKKNKNYNPSADKGDDHPYPDSLTASIRQVEIQGFFDYDDRFQVDWDLLSLHSPEIEFNEQLSSINFKDTVIYYVGRAKFDFTMSDIDIQTETATISNNSNGFVHKTFNASHSWGIIAGLFYDDYAIDDNSNNDELQKWSDEKSPFKWMVYPWHRSGAINNDINRPSDKGSTSSLLKKKVISNLRYTTTGWLTAGKVVHRNFSVTPQLFSSDEATVIKVEYPVSSYSNIYQGNVDTVLNSDSQGMFFAFDGDTITSYDKETSFTSDEWWKLYGKYRDGNVHEHGIYHFDDSKSDDKWGEPVSGSSVIGTTYEDLFITKDLIRMKYKSTPHLVIYDPGASVSIPEATTYYQLPIVEIRRSSISNMFGGTSLDALKANVWLPCGKAVLLGNKTDNDNNEITKFNYNYGDTYYQRWDCLKTYPFTREDTNQIVEIGSFMLQSHINMDGRYDRNRGQQSNLNMTPQNFNLINPVYSQKDNFFSYRIMDDDYYKNREYPNQITWTKTKTSGADIDQWTNITLASILEMDGDKGSVNKLMRFNDQLICFQDTGLSQVLYNENTQISTTDGVPIEIANSGKVQGKRYISDTIGCNNKWTICSTPSGIYFIDGYNKGIYVYQGQLQNLSVQGSMNSWCKKNIVNEKSLEWNPVDFDGFITAYDKQNQDVLFINKDIALAWSERLGTFTSFYDYGRAPYLCSLEDTGVWVVPDEGDDQEGICKLWGHQAGGYCQFFGVNKPYWMTLIGNPEPQLDKIFTNLDFRAVVSGEGETEGSAYKPYLPFDYLDTWDEYQHGVATLSTKNGHSAMLHHTLDRTSSLKRKFRIWRCDIPRNNSRNISDVFDETFDETFHGTAPGGRQDRMRNPWLYIKLYKKEADEGQTLPKAEIHDIVMTYFG